MERSLKRFELESVLSSNLPRFDERVEASLSKYITPELGLELSALREHLQLRSFKEI